MNKDCPQTSLMSQLIDGELSGEEHSSLIEHGAQCAECAQELARLQKLKSALAQLKSDPSAKQRVRRALSIPKKSIAFTSRRFWVPLPIAASMLILLGASLIGNVYWGLFRPVPERVVYKSIVITQQIPDSEKGSLALKKNNAPAVPLQANAGLRIMDSSLLRKRHKSTNSEHGKPDQEPFIATLQTDHYVAEFATTTKYQLYSAPRIYKGSIHLPEQR